MKTNFTFRHAESDEAARRYVQDRIDKLERYFHRPLEAHVVITLEKFRYQVEVTLAADGAVLTCKEESADLMAALEQMLSKIEIQAQRHRDRYKRRKGRDTEPRVEEEAEGETEGEESPAADGGGQPQIIRSNRFQPKPLSVDDAAVLLKQNSDTFIVFRNAATEIINVLYRRQDGHFGLIEPDRT